MTGPQEQTPRQFVDADLAGARFTGCSLAGAVMRGVDVDRLEIDAPWLTEDGGSLVVNGVDVAPLVDAELDRRLPGRSRRRASDPAGLCEAWEALQQTWARTIERAAAMPAGTVDTSVDGEWSFAQTLRHLVFATDVWLRRTVQRVEEPYHPIGQPHVEFATDGYDTSFLRRTPPTYDEVLAVRAERVAMVREHLAAVTPEDLLATNPSPWDPDHAQSTLSCLHVILDEEWEHLRYALRDLDALAARTAGGSPAR